VTALLQIRDVGVPSQKAIVMGWYLLIHPIWLIWILPLTVIAVDGLMNSGLYFSVNLIKILQILQILKASE
jgi:hypothetical protein